MTHNNLVLTEKAIKNHSLRLKKEMINHDKELSLAESQNLFSKILGFKNFHELKSILIKNNYADYNLYEKYLFVVLNLILDDNKKLAFKFIDEPYINEIDKFFTNEIDKFLIDSLFKKYINSKSILDICFKYKQKELIFIHFIYLVRKKMIFPCAYFLFLKKLDIKLWYLLSYSGRSLNVIKDEKLLKIFKDYQLT